MPNLRVECDGIRLESNVAFAFIGAICRALHAAGKPDGAIEVYREGAGEVWFSHTSIYQLATLGGVAGVKERICVKKVITTALYRALSHVATDSANWKTLHGSLRGRLLDNKLVSVHDGRPMLTPLGIREKVAYEVQTKQVIDVEVDDNEVIVTADQQQTPVAWWLGDTTTATARGDDVEAPMPPNMGSRQGRRPKPSTPMPLRSTTKMKRTGTGVYPVDLANATDDDLRMAAQSIGLTDTNNLRLMLKFIETTIAGRSLDELRRMAKQAQVRVPAQKGLSDEMVARRTLAAIANAGKLAEVV